MPPSLNESFISHLRERWLGYVEQLPKGLGSVKLVVWEKIGRHDRYLLTEQMGVTLTNGLDVPLNDNAQKDFTITRLTREMWTDQWSRWSILREPKDLRLVLDESSEILVCPRELGHRKPVTA